MKICILQVHHPPFDKRVFHKAAKSLRANGHTVVSIGPAETPIGERDGIQFVAIPVPRGLRHRLASVVRLVREGWRVDAEAYLAVEPESWVSALFLKAMTGRRVVFDVHEYIPTEFAKFFPPFLRGAMTWATIRAMRLMARATDHVILTKHSLDREFEGLSTPRTIVLNTNHLQPPCAAIPTALRQTYGTRPSIIHQGIFGDIRGSYQLLEALKRLRVSRPDVKCILLGQYAYGDEQAYREAIHAAGLDETIDMIAEVPFEAVPPYIAVSRIGLILFQPHGMGHTLGMPHKLFDYMREGIPVVAPDFAIEIERIVRESDCGILVDVTSPEAIANAIEHLLAHPDEARRMGENGRRAVENTYNWQRDEERLLSVFAALETKR